MRRALHPNIVALREVRAVAQGSCCRHLGAVHDGSLIHAAGSGGALDLLVCQCVTHGVPALRQVVDDSTTNKMLLVMDYLEGGPVMTREGLGG